MAPLLRVLARVDALAGQLALWLCAALLVAMTVVAGAGVVWRFALHASLSWSEELAAYLFVWLTCLGAAAGLRQRAHPSVTLLAARLPASLRLLPALVADAAVFVLGALLAWYGGSLIALMGEESAASLPVSMTWPTLAIPVGGALFMLHAVAHGAAVLAGQVAPDPVAPAHGAGE